MHRSLSIGTSRVLIVLWAAGALAFALVTRGAVALSVASGAACGVVAGLLQRVALRKDAAAFAGTATSLDVRRVLASSRSGKAAISLGWGCGIVVLPATMFLHRNGPVAAGWFAGYMAFMLVRDAFAYPALGAVLAAADDSQRRRPSPLP